MEEQYAALMAKAKMEVMESVEALAMKMVDNAIEALEIAAKQSATPIDDVVLAALKEPMKKILTDLASQISK